MSNQNFHEIVLSITPSGKAKKKKKLLGTCLWRISDDSSTDDKGKILGMCWSRLFF